ncbi:MAG: YlxR family protein [Sporichthyaceae bacterium]
MSRLTPVGPAGPSVGVSGPQRTCVGCRKRCGVADLLRVVEVDGTVVPDPRRRLPGRGASLHPNVECLTLALRRKAFPRALRVSGPLETTVLEQYLSAVSEAGGLR